MKTEISDPTPQQIRAFQRAFEDAASVYDAHRPCVVYFPMRPEASLSMTLRLIGTALSGDIAQTVPACEILNAAGERQKIGFRVVSSSKAANQKLCELLSICGQYVPDKSFAADVVKQATPLTKGLLLLLHISERPPAPFFLAEKDRWLVQDAFRAGARMVEGIADFAEQQAQPKETPKKNVAAGRKPTRGRAAKKNRAHREAKAEDLLKKNPALALRKLAKLLDCSPATASRLKAWNLYGNNKDKSPKPQAVSYSANVDNLNPIEKIREAKADAEARDGAIDKANERELRRLIAEQEKDHEPDPFSKARKRTFVSKRV